MRQVIGAAVLASLTVAAPACSSSSETAAGAGGDRQVSVVTTTTQLTDFAKEIGGAKVRVYGVLKANVDPHDYEPSPADINALAKADVIVKHGIGLEKWFDDTIKSAAPKGRIVQATQGITIRPGGRDEAAEGDPHVWHDPENAAVMVSNLAVAFEAADPGSSEVFRRNLDLYQEKLAELDADSRTKLGRLANKKLVTNHDAFGYYVDHYGLDFVGSIIPSFDTSAELSAEQVADIVAKIRSTGTKAVFSESSLPEKTAEAIGKEAGVRVVAGQDALYGDTLGPGGSDGDTYLKMEAHNTKVIVDNLS